MGEITYRKQATTMAIFCMTYLLPKLALKRSAKRMTNRLVTSMASKKAKGNCAKNWRGFKQDNELLSLFAEASATRREKLGLVRPQLFRTPEPFASSADTPC